MYENLIFDLYGTLIDIHTEEESRAFWKKFSHYMRRQGVHYHWKDLQKAYKEVIRRQEQDETVYEYPEIEIRDTFRTLCLQKGRIFAEEKIEEIARMFRRMSTCYVRLYPDTEESLKQLKASGKKLYLLSNAQTVFTMPELESLGLTNYLDGIFISSDHKCKKPDLAFMEQLLECYGLDRTRSVMIGNDVQSDVEIANRAGMDSAYLHTNLSPKLEREPRSTYASMNGKLSELIPFLLEERCSSDTIGTSIMHKKSAQK